MAESEADRIHHEFLRKLAAREQDALSSMRQAYLDLAKGWLAKLDENWKRIEQKRVAGENVPVSWLYTDQRIRKLLAEVESQVQSWADDVAAQADELQQGGAEIGLDESSAILSAVGATFIRLPKEALADMRGFLQDGSPLSDLLSTFGADAKREWELALITGLAQGMNPRDVARLVTKAAAVPLSRAERIARTEMLRSYREAHHRNYQANADVVEGWIWQSALNTRTCASCIAMHGSFHKLGERLNDHPNGRCTPIPITKTFNELGVSGLGDTRPLMRDGADWLLQQPPDIQDAVLGKEAGGLFRAGKVALHEFVQVKESKKWGPMRSVKPLAQVMKEKEDRWPRGWTEPDGIYKALKSLGMSPAWNQGDFGKAGASARASYSAEERSINLSRDVRLELRKRDSSGFRSALHEFLHAVSFATTGVTPGRFGGAYVRGLGNLEELTVELNARRLLPKIMADAGEPYKAPKILGYGALTRPFEEEMLKHMSRERFDAMLERLLRTSLLERKQVLVNEIAQAARLTADEARRIMILLT